MTQPLGLTPKQEQAYVAYLFSEGGFGGRATKDGRAAPA